MSIGTTAAIIGGAVIGGGATIAASSIAGNAAKEAAKTSADATERAIAVQREDADKAIAELRPFTDPTSAYAESEREAATKAIQRKLAAQGLLNSGGQVRGLVDLERSLADRRLNAATAIAGIRAGVGPNVANTITSGANTQVQTGLAGADAARSGLVSLNNLVQGLGSSFLTLNNQKIQQEQFNSLLNSLNGGGGGANLATLANQIGTYGVPSLPTFGSSLRF